MSLADRRLGRSWTSTASPRRDVRIVDAFFHELALDASEDPSPPAPEEKDDVDAIALFVARLTAAAG